jgi:hypothetical protein
MLYEIGQAAKVVCVTFRIIWHKTVNIIWQVFPSWGMRQPAVSEAESSISSAEELADAE